MVAGVLLLLFFGFIYLHDHNCHPYHHHNDHRPQHAQPVICALFFCLCNHFSDPSNRYTLCICFVPLFFAPCTLRGLSRLRRVSSLWSRFKCVLQVYLIINRFIVDIYLMLIGLDWFHTYAPALSISSFSCCSYERVVFRTEQINLHVIPDICYCSISLALIAGCLSMKYWVLKLQVPTQYDSLLPMIFVQLLRQCFSHTDPNLLIFLHFLK